MKTHDVVWASDNNYLPYVTTSVLSFCENNLDWIVKDGKLVIHILEEDFSGEDKEKIVKMVKGVQEKSANVGKIEVVFYDMKIWCKELRLKESIAIKNKNGYPPSAYFRLFVGQILPSEVERVLYLDSDSLVLGSFEEVLKMDLENNVIAGVSEVMITVDYKRKFGLGSNDLYVNSGVCLMDLNKIRAEEIWERFVLYIENHELPCADQDVLNTLLIGRIALIHPKFNLQNYLLNHTVEYFSHYTSGSKMFYTQMLVDEAIKNPVFIHDKLWCRYTSFYSPFTKKYWSYFVRNPFGIKKVSRLSWLAEAKICAVSLVRKILGIKFCDKIMLMFCRF